MQFHSMLFYQSYKVKYWLKWSWMKYIPLNNITNISLRRVYCVCSISTFLSIYIKLKIYYKRRAEKFITCENLIYLCCSLLWIIVKYELTRHTFQTLRDFMTDWHNGKVFSIICTLFTANEILTKSFKSKYFPLKLRKK